MCLVSVMVREAAEGGAGLYQSYDLCCHRLGPVCADAWQWGGWGGGGFQRLQFVELGVN